MTGNPRVLIVLMGLPSSGKSTIAKLLAKELQVTYNLNNVVIGTDDVRQLIPSQIEKFDPTIEPFIKNLTLNAIQFSLRNNYSVINDDMNYYKSMRHELKEIAEENQAHFVLIHVEIPLETALSWNEKRGLPIPQEVIRRVHDRFDPPGDYKWDDPLVTIQSDEMSPESATKMIISKLLPVIKTPYKREAPPLSTKPGINEKIDKITREIISEFAQLNKDPQLLKKVSKFRIQYLKNLPDKEIPMDSLTKDFSQKLQEFISSIKQAK
ncbi:MAG: AAA family ATPase [Candidatus Helarchaeota archaeon]|nr:AAA family ATPase [Candidatus Helarchaeota archaeon]